MKKSHLSHLAWAFVAITAFVIGSQLTSPEESKEANSSNSPSSRLSSRSNPNQGSLSDEDKARAKSSRRSASSSAEATVLTDADINALRDEGRDMACYVQGMESANCLVRDGKDVREVGVWLFPG